MVQNKFRTAMVQITGAHLPSPTIQYRWTKFQRINEIEIIPKMAGLLVLNHSDEMISSHSACSPSMADLWDLWVYRAPELPPHRRQWSPTASQARLRNAEAAKQFWLICPTLIEKR